MKLPVSEIFYTIQGEGAKAGTPAVFVRLQGCPVHCPWCDTKHTWSLLKANEVSSLEMMAKGGSNPRPTYALMEYGAIIDEIESLVPRPENPPLIVITGGEPMVHKDNLIDFINLLSSYNYQVQIETSGTVSFLDLMMQCDVRPYITVSPKLGINPNLPVLIEELHHADEIKVVVGSPQDFEAWEMARASTRWINPQHIYLQPNATIPTATDLCIKLVKAEGYRLSLQTHKLVGIE